MNQLPDIAKLILALTLIIVFVLGCYLLIRVYLNGNKKHYETKMLTLNRIIRTNDFKKYYQYMLEKEESFSLYMIQMNHYDLVLNKYPETMIKQLMRFFAKNVSVSLPKGGKLTQLKDRNTFILLVPHHEFTDNDFQIMLKNAAVIPLNYQNEQVIIDVSIAELKNPIDDLLKAIEKLQKALIESKRQLGRVITYSDDYPYELASYRAIMNEVSLEKANLVVYEVNKLSLNKVEEYFYEVNFNGKSLSEIMKEASPKDRAWINMYIIEIILAGYLKQQGSHMINLPIYEDTLKESNMPWLLERLLIKYRISIEKTILSIEGTLNDPSEILKNILTLNKVGYKLSYLLENLNPVMIENLFNLELNRIELNVTPMMNLNELERIVYSAKTNHQEILVRNAYDLVGATHKLSRKEVIGFKNQTKKVAGRNK
ncbi:MAG TPA: hypothetical protein VK005_01480 [Acholeplasma sp.]|nr:hypothetical protein [Acholeplasma sp.]